MRFEQSVVNTPLRDTVRRGVTAISQYDEFRFVPALIRLVAQREPVSVAQLAAAGGWSEQEVRAVDWDEAGRLDGPAMMGNMSVSLAQNAYTVRPSNVNVCDVGRRVRRWGSVLTTRSGVTSTRIGWPVPGASDSITPERARHVELSPGRDPPSGNPGTCRISILVIGARSASCGGGCEVPARHLHDLPVEVELLGDRVKHALGVGSQPPSRRLP
jgi:hypothetical protein